MPATNFREVLAAAVEDLTRNGFDSSERVERWMRQLREAARASLISAASLEQTLRDALAAEYRRMVDQGGVLKLNPGVDRFTLDRIKPALRGELDRRIVASADLIRLNRAQAIDKTISRFQGWATSIPAGGGVTGESKQTIKKDVSKSLAQLPFVERRVLIDQGHKLVSSISDVIARDGGAVAARWRSHWRQPGYDYREDHKDRDDGVFLVRDSWAHTAGMVKKGRPGYVDEVTQPAQEPFCRCYWIWLYSLRELPEAMLTTKGKQALQAVEGRAEVRAARTGRADAAGKMDQQAAAYGRVWADRPTRCVRCSMFVPGPRLYDDNACTAVEGRIAAHGHCRLFETRGHAYADAVEPVHGGSTIPVPVDRDHDVPWMFVVSKDCKRLYVDRTLERSVTFPGKAGPDVTFDPARPGWAHESGEWLWMMKLVAKFLEAYGRHPDEQERELIYDKAHEHGGVPAERAEIDRLGVDWKAWEAWSRGKLAALEHKAVRRPVPDPHVSPVHGNHNQPMSNLSPNSSVEKIDMPTEAHRAYEQALARDRLGYLNGVSSIVEVPDRTNWNAHYDADKDEIVLEGKFARKQFDDKVQTILHEGAHRGQEIDPDTYEAFKSLGLNKLSSFRAIANPTHLADYARNGIDNVAEEVFAESYARAMLGLDMPQELAQFWQTRVAT